MRKLVYLALRLLYYDVTNPESRPREMAHGPVRWLTGESLIHTNKFS